MRFSVISPAAVRPASTTGDRAKRYGQFQQPKFATGKRIGVGIHSSSEADFFNIAAASSRSCCFVCVAPAAEKCAQQRRFAVPVTR